MNPMDEFILKIYGCDNLISEDIFSIRSKCEIHLSHHWCSNLRNTLALSQISRMLLLPSWIPRNPQEHVDLRHGSPAWHLKIFTEPREKQMKRIDTWEYFNHWNVNPKPWNWFGLKVNILKDQHRNLTLQPSRL